MQNIKTDNKYRLIYDGYSLTEKERAEFDYIDWEAVDTGKEEPEFVKYKGQLYDLSEFTRVSDGSPLKGWDGIKSEHPFSSLVVRYSPDRNKVMVGRCFS